MANEKKRKAEPAKKGSPAKKQKVEPKVKPSPKTAKKGTVKPKKVVVSKKTPVSKPKKNYAKSSKTKTNVKSNKPANKTTKDSKNKKAVVKPVKSKSTSKTGDKVSKTAANKKQPANKTAVKTVVKKAQVKVAVKKTPVKAASKKTPVKPEVKKGQVKEKAKKTQVKGVVKKAPVKAEVKKAPVKAEVKKAPVKAEVKKAPVKKPVKKMPVQQENSPKKPIPKAKTQTAAAKLKLKALKQINSKKSKDLGVIKPAKQENIPKQSKSNPAAKSKQDKATKPKIGKTVKRKAETEEPETPRKRRVITPNKKYADFEVGISPKKVSELRAFIQDKKKDPEDTNEENTPAKPTGIKPKEVKAEGKKSAELKVIKPSEMKPAEKLLKKLQKKLEREAKAASVSKPENKVNKDKAKFKITKVVTYNKKPPLMAKAKALTKTLVAKQKAPILKAEKTNSFKTLTSKPKPAAKAKPGLAKVKATHGSNGEAQKGTPTKLSQAADKTKPKKIKEIKREDRPIQAEFVHQKNVRFNDDPNQNCWITGIDVFPSGEIVLVDMGNKKIKLFTSDFQKSSQVKLDTIPQDLSISPIDASSAYFTKPFSKEGIQKLSMSDGKLTLRESFFTNGTNRGISCTKAGILTSVQDGRYHDLDINCFKIDLLDYEGKILKSVSVDTKGERLFKLPLYFAVNNTGKQVIVSDCIRNNSYIISLDLTGKVQFKYTGNLITPRGLTVDDENNIYVTEWDKHNVYILSPTGKRLQMLFNSSELQEQGLDGLAKPYQLCFKKREDGGQLFVSQEGCNTVKVFRVFKKQSVPEPTAQGEETKPADGEKVEQKTEVQSTEVQSEPEPSASDAPES